MEHEKEKQKSADWYLPASILLSAIVLTVAWNYNPKNPITSTLGDKELRGMEESILPPDGVILPVEWGDLGVKMTTAGLIDPQKFEEIYKNRGGMSEQARKMLYETGNGNIKMTLQNSGEILNLLWALGLGNKNEILESGPMANYDGKTPATTAEFAKKVGGFASTGGWTLAKGNPMNYYSKFNFITLTREQQLLAERVSKGIFRPCCGNSTHFPDCNHGMAMLALVELMASQGMSEEDMYKVALQVNAYWFPDTYLTIGKYLAMKNMSWGKADPKEILGSSYSSASGFSAILREVEPVDSSGGGGCGV